MSRPQCIDDILQLNIRDASVLARQEGVSIMGCRTREEIHDRLIQHFNNIPGTSQMPEVSAEEAIFDDRHFTINPVKVKVHLEGPFTCRSPIHLHVSPTIDIGSYDIYVLLSTQTKRYTISLLLIDLAIMSG